MIVLRPIHRILHRAVRALSLVLILTPSLAWAADGDCTWFPDLRCEREGGRYEGFVMPMADPVHL